MNRNALSRDRLKSLIESVANLPHDVHLGVADQNHFRFIRRYIHVLDALACIEHSPLKDILTKDARQGCQQ